MFEKKAIETHSVSLNVNPLWVYDKIVSSIALHTLTRFKRILHIKVEIESER